MNDTSLRRIIFYKNYFSDFYIKQKQKVRDKILWVFRIIETQPQIPSEYLKHIEGTDGLYEIRAQQGGDIFRIFCFFGEGRIIVLTSGFQKKTQKLPYHEIQKAIKIKKEYEAEN